MNENSANQILRHYESIQSLPRGDFSQASPSGSGDARFNDLLRVACDSQRICSIEPGSVDTTKLSTTTQSISSFTAIQSFSGNSEIDDTSYDKCMKEYERSLNKSGSINWQCDAMTGAKIWD